VKQGVQYILHKRKIYRIIFVHCVNNETFKENKMTKSKSERLIEALRKGEELTAGQIKARFGIANPTATVSDLRLRGGFAVYANQAKDTKGRVSTKYRLGVPSRTVVAAGYRALALGLV
jgi:predicted ArsR family transcriptional regulator